MTKETVRFPDEVVAAVEDVIDEGIFESKSEFYRFAAEYVLESLSDEYEPASFDFEEIVDDLEARHGVGADPAPDGEGEDRFLAAVLEVRKRVFRGNAESAAALIDERYDTGDVEAVVLEELLDRYDDR